MYVWAVSSLIRNYKHSICIC